MISSDTFVKDFIYERYLFPLRSVSFHCQSPFIIRLDITTLPIRCPGMDPD